MMIWWWEHGEKGVTDGQTDGQTDGLNQSYSCLVAAKNTRKLFYVSFHIDGVAQDCSNSIANALELLQSPAKPLTW